MFYKPLNTVRPIYSGGAITLRNNLLASSFDDELKITNFSTGDLLASLNLDTEPVTAIAISRDSSVLVACTQAFQIHVVDLESKKVIRSIHKAHEAPIMAIAINSTGSLVATGGAEGAVKVWDIKKGYCTHNFKGHGGVITALVFYGDAGGYDWRLISASDDSKVRAWDLVSSKTIKVLDNHTNTVRGLAISQDGEWILSGGRDKVLSFWKDYQLAATIPVMEEVEATGFFGNFIYTGSPKSLQLWSQEGEHLSTLKINQTEDVDLIDVLQDGDTLVAVLSDQSLLQAAVEEGELKKVRDFAGNHGEIIDAVVDGGDRLVIATNSPEIRVLNPLNMLEFSPLVGHTDIVIAIDVNGRWLVSAGKDRSVRLWDLESADCKAVFTGHAGSIGAVAISRSKGLPKFILSGSEDQTIKKWAPDGSAEYTRKAHDKDINSLDVTSDDSRFATGSQDKTIKIWNTENGEVIGVLKGHRRGIWNVRFDATGSTLVSGSGDKTVRLWDLHNYTCLRTFEGHTNSVLKVLFYRNDIIASAGGDGLVKMWDTKTAETLGTLDNHEDKVWSLTKNNEGELISASGDGVITVWQDYTEQQKEEDETKHREDVEKQQELENSVRNQQWHRAIEIALDLNHPLRLLKLFKSVQEYEEQGSITGVVAVDDIIGNLHGEKLTKLFERLRDWNTNASTSITAQTILRCLLTTHPMKELQNARIISVLAGVLPYSQRHLSRMEDLLETTYTLDYILKEMSL